MGESIILNKLSSRIWKRKREIEAGLSRTRSYALVQVSHSPTQTPAEAVALSSSPFVDIYRSEPISKKLSNMKGATS